MESKPFACLSLWQDVRPFWSLDTFVHAHGNLTFTLSRLVFSTQESVTYTWSSGNIKLTWGEGVRVFKALRKSLQTRCQFLWWNSTSSCCGQCFLYLVSTSFCINVWLPRVKYILSLGLLNVFFNHIIGSTYWTSRF